MYKPFIDVEEVDYLHPLLSFPYSSIREEFTSFINSYSKEEKTKYNYLLKHRFVKMISMLIFNKCKIYKNLEKNDDFFNLSTFTPEQNSDYGKGQYAKLFEKEFGHSNFNHSNTQKVFGKTMKLLNSSPHFESAWFLIYKDGAYVAPHTHDDGRLIIHFLIDIEGEFKIQVNEEVRRFTQPNSYFLFPGWMNHSAKFKGIRCTYFTILTNPHP